MPCRKFSYLQGRTKVPDQFVIGVEFTEACKFYDNCYDGMFGCSVSKATCDFDFYAKMIQACEKTAAYFRGTCIAFATTYYAGVQHPDARNAFDAALAAGVCKNAAACP